MGESIPLVAVILAAYLAPLRAQTRTTASPPFDGTRLKAFSLRGTVYTVKGSDTVLAGQYTQELLVHHNDLVLVNASNSTILGQIIDTLVVRRPDLKPIAYYQRSPRGTSRVDFRRSDARGSPSKTFAYVLLTLAGAAGGMVWWMLIQPSSSILVAMGSGALLTQALVALELWLAKAAA